MKKDEYLMLRKEIEYNLQKEDSYSKFAYTISIATWTITFSEVLGNEWILFFTMLILLPLSLRVWDCRNSISFIASYMITNLEQSIDFKWETLSWKYRKNFKRSLIEKMTYYISRFDFIILLASNSIMFWKVRDWNFKIHNNTTLAVLLLLMQGLFITIEIVLALKFTNIKNLKDKKISNWNKLFWNKY